MKNNSTTTVRCGKVVEFSVLEVLDEMEVQEVSADGK